MDDKKPASESRTVLFNVLSAILLVLSDHNDVVHRLMGDGGYIVTMCAAAAINVYLRSITTQPIKW
ncbi:MAG: hypothetical protein CTY18_03075 [Methylomonas sp.]|nr:MAG: hypothetical protein CTY18_03075 [Methylomonas sp.]